MPLSVLQDFVEEREYIKAIEALRQEGHPYTSETAILDAAVYESLRDREHAFREGRDGLQYALAGDRPEHRSG